MPLPKKRNSISFVQYLLCNSDCQVTPDFNCIFGALKKNYVSYLSFSLFELVTKTKTIIKTWKARYEKFNQHNKNN